MTTAHHRIVETILQRIDELEPACAETMGLANGIFQDIALAEIAQDDKHHLTALLLDRLAAMREFDPKFFNALPIVCPKSCANQ